MPSEPAPASPPPAAVPTTYEALWPGVRAALLRAVADRGGSRRPVLVGVDGRSGAGKTDLATCLAGGVRGLSLTCAVLHLDDLYPGWSGLARALRPLCRDVVGPLTRGEDGAYTSWDWSASAPGPRRVVPVRDVVVVEGVGVLAAACATDLDLRVWLEAPSGVRRARALDRDGAVFAPHWQEWSEQEEELFGDGVPVAAQVVADTQTGSVRWSGPTP